MTSQKGTEKSVRPPQCPICDSNKWAKTLMPAYNRVMDGKWNQQSLNNKRHMIKNPDADIDMCMRCGLVFERSNHGEDYYKEFYKEKNPANAEVYIETDTWKSHKRKPILKKHLAENPDSILEIASASGANLDEFRTFFKSSTNIGIEPHSNYVEYSTRVFPEITTIQTRWENFETDRKFDLVVAGYCVGHLVDPLASFRKILDVLEDNGYLYIDDAGNPLTYFNEVHGRSFAQLMPYNKRFCYTPTNLSHLLEKVGFTVVETGEYFNEAASVPKPAMYFVCKKSKVPISVSPENFEEADLIYKSFKRAKRKIMVRNTLGIIKPLVPKKIITMVKNIR